MKKTFSILAFVLLFAIPAKAANLSGFNLDAVTYRDISIDPTPAVVPPFAPEPKEWTVMFYSTTKDNLRYILMAQLLDMKKTGSTDKVNALVQFALPIKHFDGSISTPTIRMALGKAGNSAALDQVMNKMLSAHGAIDENILTSFSGDIVMQKNNTDTGNWREAAEFTKWAKTNYPAKRYAFVINGHGNGFFDAKKTVNKGTLKDKDTGNYVTLPEMRLLMAETGKVDIFIMTSCLMQMAEVAWQIKDYTSVIVGSSEKMWEIGFGMKGLLDTLNSTPGILSEDLGTALADDYIASLKLMKLGGGHASVIVTSKLPAFAQKLNAWVDAEMAFQDRVALAKLTRYADIIKFDLYGLASTTTAKMYAISGDLYDFVRNVEKYTPQDTQAQLFAAQKGRELMDYISVELVYKYAYIGTSDAGQDFGQAHGLSIYLPRADMLFGSLSEFEKTLEINYWELPFARETKWGEFLSWIYNRN